MRLKMTAAAVVASALLGAFVAIAVTQVWLDDDDPAPTTNKDQTPAATGAASTEASPSGGLSLESSCVSAADIFEQLRPAVVEITSIAGGGGTFGAPAQGTGTGIIFDEEGFILTNNHVIAGADSLEVKFDDGSVMPAELVGRDPGNDLAVIQIEGFDGPLSVAPLGDSDAMRVGDPVLAIGNPFNLEGTLTQGIVSAVGRTFATGGSTRPIRDMIQTDAPVNPGNSGGPLVNCRAEVIGVNTLLENPTGDNVNVGIAFAVPANSVTRSLPEMLAGETVGHPWLGIAGQEVTPALAADLDLSVEAGVYISFVSPGSPADRAGLEGAFGSEAEAAQSSDLAAGGDVIVAADGQAMDSIDDLAAYLDVEKRPGDSVELLVVRDGEELSVEATLGEWPE